MDFRGMPIHKALEECVTNNHLLRTSQAMLIEQGTVMAGMILTLGCDQKKEGHCPICDQLTMWDRAMKLAEERAERSA